MGKSGIINGGSGTIQTLNNSGEITGDSYGIYNDDTIGTFINSGTIDGDIYNTSPNTLKALKNSGNINGIIHNPATGVIGSDTQEFAIENTGTIKGINNAGTIIAKKYAINNKSGDITSVSNSGTVIFKDKDGAQIYNNAGAKTTITSWNINLNKSASEFNDLSKIDTTNGNSAYADERIFVGGDLSGISFAPNSIIVKTNQQATYDLSYLILQNNGAGGGATNWTSATSSISGGGLSCSSFSIQGV